jgi:hypothetical protein
MDYKRYSKWKEKQFKRLDGKCEYCDCDMILSGPVPKHKKIPLNLATIDHKYSKEHPLRNTKCINNERRLFLVCWKCNHEKYKSENYTNKMKYIWGTPY